MTSKASSDAPFYRPMEIDLGRAQSLVAAPSESLSVEIKRWITPATPEGRAKIAKALIGLRNRGGGYLVVGFDDKTLQPDAANTPDNPRKIFHIDQIQGLVSKHASEVFDIAVTFVERDGREHPVIVVPPGVRTPVAVKSPIANEKREELLKFGEVPFRTLNSNGRVSTADAGPNDWRDIVEICFENREADLGRFIRRHLTESNLSMVAKTLSVTPEKSENLEQSAQQLLRSGYASYEKLAAERGIAAEEKPATDWGKWEVAVVISPPMPDAVPYEGTYSTLVSNNPGYTTWPSWPDTRPFNDMYASPQVRERAWQSLVISLGPRIPWDFFLFSYLNPKGKFYQLKALDDDAMARARGAQVGAVFDHGLAVSQVAEAMAVGMAYAKALGSDPANTTLAFAFRWTGLSGRCLAGWSSQSMPFITPHRAHDKEISSSVAIPLDTSEAALAPYAHKATKELFAAFGGYSMSLQAAEQRVHHMLERRT